LFYLALPRAVYILKNFKALKRLHINSTSSEPGQRKKIREALPEVKVTWMKTVLSAASPGKK
jgi:hypothetical protein